MYLQPCKVVRGALFRFAFVCVVCVCYALALVMKKFVSLLFVLCAAQISQRNRCISCAAMQNGVRVGMQRYVVRWLGRNPTLAAERH